MLTVLGFFALLLAIGTTGATGDRGRELREQQGQIQGRIESLRRDLKESERSHADLREELRRTEAAIAEVSARLHQAALARQAVRRELSELERQRRELDQSAQGQQEQLARLLRRHLWHGESDALKQLVAGVDPHHLARDLHYLKQLARAKAELIGDLKRMAQEKRRLAEQERERHARLAEIEHEEQAERSALQQKQRERQAMLDRLAVRIREQKREIDTLRRNEQRLAALIETLARRKPPAAKPVPAAGPKPARPAAAPTTASPLPAEPVAASGAFAALKGKLVLPVKGEISARFGMARSEGGPSWKGIFIRVAAGSEVHAVANGTVAYADYLRGYGNLLILDHGDGFLSVYGNNEALLKQVGDRLRANEVLATAGSGGSGPESGLYFELRHRGQPFDPLRWARPR